MRSEEMGKYLSARVVMDPKRSGTLRAANILFGGERNGETPAAGIPINATYICGS